MVDQGYQEGKHESLLSVFAPPILHIITSSSLQELRLAAHELGDIL